jgi:Holliday junction resolvase RusA-like endonuclease
MKLTPEIERAMRASGVYPEALRGKPKSVAPEVYQGLPGELIVELVVPSRPVPWKAPTTTRTGHSFKDKKLVEWQKLVAGQAAIAMGSRYPHPGPIDLTLRFELTRKPGSVPDLSNLTKALEDSLQGIVFVNDRWVSHIDATRRIGPHDRVTISVRVGEAS